MNTDVIKQSALIRVYLRLSLPILPISAPSGVVVLIGLPFTIAGGCMLYFGTTPIVFDTKKESFWIGRPGHGKVLDKDKLKHFAELDEIHALQLISEYCEGDKSYFYSYELNLVLKDGKRINVVDHKDEGQLLDDVDTLAAFLGKSVWDGIE